jgi:3-hydroxybutyryl-CoA dehydratase
MLEKPRACKTADELEIGEKFELEYEISDDDLRKFAELSGDWNPVHFDDDFAGKSMFRGRIAHGMISVAKFSGIFGMDMPGLGTLWEMQEVQFLAPVFPRRRYKAIAQVTGKNRRRVEIATWVEDEDGQRVLSGRAQVLPISALQRNRLAD